MATPMLRLFACLVLLLAVCDGASGGRLRAARLQGAQDPDPVGGATGAAGGAAEGASGAVANTGSAATGEVGKSVSGVASGQIPDAGDALDRNTGVPVNKVNPKNYLGAIIGGGAAGTAISVGIFAIATYMAYSWNQQIKEAGDTPKCGIMSILCCLCCTPFVCCCPIDRADKE